MNDEKKLNEKELNEEELDKVAGGILGIDIIYNWLKDGGYIEEARRLAREERAKGKGDRTVYVKYITEVLLTKAPESIKCHANYSMPMIANYICEVDYEFKPDGSMICH